jgi:hypothetical protein
LALILSTVGCSSAAPDDNENDAGLFDSGGLDLGETFDAGPFDAELEDVPVIRDGGSVTDLGDESQPLDVDDLIYAMSLKYCHELFMCPTTMDSDTERMVKLQQSDEVQCVRGYVRLLSSYSRLQENVARVHAGTLAFDGLAAHACLGITDCERFDLDGVGSHGPCDTMFDGMVAVGDTCETSDDCAGIDTYCAIADGTCAGTCQPTVAAGGECREGRDCATDGATRLVACDQSGSTSACKAFEYGTAAPSEGVTCGMTSNETTITHTNCPAGFYCDSPTWTSAGVCRMQLGEGSSCARTHVCSASYVCSRGESPVCAQPTPLAQFIGEVCSDADGPLCDNWRNLGCVRGHCVALGDGTLGSECNYRSFCNAGLHCDETDHCAPQRAGGESCNGPGDCLSGLCNEPALTCAPVPAC